MSTLVQHTATIMILFLLSINCVAKDDDQNLWIVGQEAYLNGEYDRAINTFLATLQDQPSSLEAMYNLGNCYLQKDDPGMAILWYERALKLRPTDHAVRHNLAIANARRDNAAVEIRQFFLLRWIRGVSNQFSVRAWACLSLLLLWGALGLSGISLLRRSWHRRTLAAMICGGLCILAMVFGAQRYHDAHRTDLAVVTSGTPMTIAPDAGSKQVSILSAGEKVMVLDSLQHYLKVRVVNFEQGWVPASSVSRI